MKYLPYLFVIVIYFASCEKEELLYSCDPEINAIVKSASNEFSEISLNEFLEYDIVLRNAIYRSLTPEKVRKFWLQKLDSVKTVNSYIEEEKLHIQKLIDHLSIDYFNFTKIDPITLDSRLDFFNEWSNYAIIHFNWTAKHIRYITFSLCITKEQYDSDVMERRENTLYSMSSDCHCAVEADCDDVFLPCVNDEECNVSRGCGFLLLTDCTGTCQ